MARTAFTYIYTVLAAWSVAVHAYPWAGNALNNTKPVPYPQWRGPRCANDSSHAYVVNQFWWNSGDMQITRDCFAYGVASYTGLEACAMRNVCFGNCSRTYEDCIKEWIRDPETQIAHAQSFADKMWESLPLEQYYRYSNMSCHCNEVKTCGHVGEHVDC